MMIWIFIANSVMIPNELSGSVDNVAVTRNNKFVICLVCMFASCGIFVRCMDLIFCMVFGSFCGMAWDKKHSKAELEEVAKKASSVKDSKDDKDDKDNWLEFAVNGSVVANKLQLQSVCIHEGHLKLKVCSIAEVLDWTEQTNLHK